MYTQGYLENVQKLIKKTKGIIEENMRKIEFVDSLVRKVFNVRLYVLLVFTVMRALRNQQLEVDQYAQMISTEN